VSLVPKVEGGDEKESAVQLSFAARVSLRVPTSREEPLLRKWLQASRVERHRTSPLLGTGRSLTPSEQLVWRIVWVESEPVGYARFRPVDPAWLKTTVLAGLVPTDTLEIDVFVGNYERRGLGIGTEAIVRLRRLIRELHGNRCVMAKSSVHDLASRRAHEKAGLCEHYFYEDPGLGPAVAMIHFGGSDRG